MKACVVTHTLTDGSLTFGVAIVDNATTIIECVTETDARALCHAIECHAVGVHCESPGWVKPVDTRTIPLFTYHYGESTLSIE